MASREQTKTVLHRFEYSLGLLLPQLEEASELTECARTAAGEPCADGRRRQRRHAGTSPDRRSEPGSCVTLRLRCQGATLSSRTLILNTDRRRIDVSNRDAISILKNAGLESSPVAKVSAEGEKSRCLTALSTAQAARLMAHAARVAPSTTGREIAPHCLWSRRSTADPIARVAPRPRERLLPSRLSPTDAIGQNAFGALVRETISVTLFR